MLQARALDRGSTGRTMAGRGDASPATTLPAPARHVLRAAAWLTTPLLPADYLALVNPLWSTRELRGRVERVEPETADAATLVIRPGRGWPGHRAGQYVGVGVEINGARHWRNYSVTSPATDSAGLFSITVQAVAGGRVSPQLVHHTPAGSMLSLRAAQGDFRLPDTLPDRVLFITAGSGITPVLGMLRTLAATTMPDVVLLHSARSAATSLFATELTELADRFPGLRVHPRHTATDGRLALADLARWCPDWQHRPAWACGPTAMLEDITTHWARAGLSGRLHVEHFRPPLWGVSAQGRHPVRFLRTGATADADAAAPLLAVGEEAGVMMPSGCRMGICFGCVVPLRSGRVRDLRTGDVHGEADELVQTCISAAAGPIEIDL